MRPLNSLAEVAKRLKLSFGQSWPETLVQILVGEEVDRVRKRQPNAEWCAPKTGWRKDVRVPYQRASTVLLQKGPEDLVEIRDCGTDSHPSCDDTVHTLLDFVVQWVATFGRVWDVAQWLDCLVALLSSC